MTTARRNHLTTDYNHSPYISERRRKLFPAEDCDGESELGHISPIRSDDASDSETDSGKLRIGTFHGSDTPMSNRACSETMSPLKLSPCTGSYLRATPRKFSPSQNLKTPHDTSRKPVLEKEQKVLLEESKSLKRKGSLTDSPEHCKIFKSDTKPSKVRTALFPELDTMSLPTKSFYSKTPDSALEKRKPKYTYKPIKFSVARPGHRSGRKLGQINNGVRHKIRRPKKKKISKTVIAKATKMMLETNSALNEYIQDLSELKNKQNVQQKRIEPVVEEPELAEYLQDIKELQKTRKQIITPKIQQNNKENIPHSPEDDASKNRKFFKSSRATAVKEFVFEETIEQQKELEPEKLTSNSFNDFDEDDTEPQANIDNILSVLSAESPQKSFEETPSSQVMFQEHLNPDKIVLHAHCSITNSENSIQLHQPNVANMILSPISQMCDVTSGLALNSPRKGRDVSALFNGTSRASKMLSFNGDCYSVDMDKKLFPVFNKGTSSGGCVQNQRGEKRERSEVLKKSAKKFKALPPDQMLLDAGQKKFGHTLCNECNIVYHMGDPNDEIEHLNYHNAQHVLSFAGWKNEHVVAEFPRKGRIIKVVPSDSKIWLKKVNDLMEVVKRDLGCYEMDHDITCSQVYLYIKSRTIAGCAVATIPKERGHRMLSSLTGVAMCSEESYPIKCGISHIWVASNFRKQGIASGLVDAVKRNFAFGEILTNDDIALTSPTEAGSAFAEKYFKTPNYLIYYI